MKRSVLILFLLAVHSQSDSQTNAVVRLRELSSMQSAAAYEEINSLLNQSNIPSEIQSGYRSIAVFMLCKISDSPFDKLKYFKNGKSIMEKAIEENKDCVELRFLRFCVQTNSPWFLNYTSDISIDKIFIMQSWNKLQDEDLKNRIKTVMLQSTSCNDIEKQFFRT
jgi:hypothetical protein